MLRHLLHGRTASAFNVLAALAVTVWAGDETIRGVNPWRRLLGALVLGALITSTVTTA